MSPLHVGTSLKPHERQVVYPHVLPMSARSLSFLVKLLFLTFQRVFFFREITKLRVLTHHYSSHELEARADIRSDRRRNASRFERGDPRLAAVRPSAAGEQDVQFPDIVRVKVVT